MFEFIEPQSTAELAIAVRANLHEFCRYFGRSGHASVMTLPAMTRWHTQIMHPWFNGILCRTPLSESSANLVAEAIEYFKSQNVHAITGWMAPDVSIDTWRDWFERNGFTYDANTPGMALSTSELDPALISLPDFNVELVTHSAELKMWAETFVAGYQIPADWANSLYELMNDLGLEWPNRCYLGYWRGKPVATSNIFIGAGVAGIQCVATLEEARRRGFGAAITAAPLLDAQAIGCKIGILQSSDLGRRAYERVGFRQVCQMEHFYRNLTLPI